MLVQTVTYPATRKGDVIDDYHGTKVADPYRWLEDVDSPETHSWVEAENRVTFAYLEQIPERERIRRRLTELWDYPKYGAPFKKGGRYFFFKNSGLQNQSVLYTQSALTAEPAVLLDPNTLSSDGTVALSILAFAEDGRTMVYGTSGSGSDWQEFRVRDVATRQDRPDHLKWIKFSSAAWTHDGAGFFYSRYPEPTAGIDPLLEVNHNQKVYYHKLGTDQSADRLIYERPDHPDWGFGVEVSADGRYAVYTVWLGTDRRNRIYYQNLGDPKHPRLDAAVVRLLDGFDASYGFVGNTGPVFYFQTDNGAPRGRIIAVDTRRPEPAAWREVVPQAPDVIEGSQIVHNTFVIRYLHDAYSQLRLFALDGKPAGTVPLPTLGSIVQVTGEPHDTEMFYAFTSFLYPTTIFRHDFTTGVSTVFKAPEIAFDPSKYETVQVFYHSKDGTRVPLFLTYQKGRGVASGGDAGPQAKRVRRLHRRRRVPDRGALHLTAQAGDRRRLERRVVDRHCPQSTARAVRRRAAGRRCDGYVALPQVHDRLGVGDGVRVGRQPGAVPLPLPLLADSQHETRHTLSRDAYYDGGSRRPRRARPFVQVRRDLAVGPGWT